MPAFVRSPRDFLAGLMFIVIGVSALIIAREYPFGSAVRMGPGYFPTVLGGLLAVIGLVCLLESLSAKGPALEKMALKPLVLVCLSTVLFGLMLRNVGSFFAIGFLVFMSAYASIKFRWAVAARIFVIMMVFCYLIFIKALGLPMPLLGAWFA